MWVARWRRLGAFGRDVGGALLGQACARAEADLQCYATSGEGGSQGDEPRSRFETFCVLESGSAGKAAGIMGIQGERALVGASLEYESTTSTQVIRTEDELVKEMRHMQPLM